MSFVELQQNQIGTSQSEHFTELDSSIYVNELMVSGSLINMLNEDVHNSESISINEGLVTSVLTSASSDWSSDKLQSFINDLAKENSSLKVQVARNSVLMKSFLKWYNLRAAQDNKVQANLTELQLKLDEVQQKLDEVQENNQQLVKVNIELNERCKEMESTLEMVQRTIKDEDNGFEVITENETNAANAEFEGKNIFKRKQLGEQEHRSLLPKLKKLFAKNWKAKTCYEVEQIGDMYICKGCQTTFTSLRGIEKHISDSQEQ